MKKIIHLSDLHFGTERPGSVNLLIADIQTLNPDVIVVSGDLTQRARKSQFQTTKDFLGKIDSIPIVCVPGNHDIALYNLLERFIYPFAKYRKYINKDINPEYYDDNIAILGINSVTPYKPMGGFVTKQQLERVNDFFHRQAKSKIKIVAMHHNLIRSERHKIINDADEIIATFAACHVNLVLSGHIHYAHIEQLKKSNIEHNIYIVTAGTAISTRTAAPNSFNIIEFDETQFKLSVRELNENRYITQSETTFNL